MVKYQNYFSIIFLLNLNMRDFLHKVKKKNRITIEFMYTYCSHSDITSKNMM